MDEPKTAADLLADDPNFKNYFQSHPQQAGATSSSADVPAQPLVTGTTLPSVKPVLTDQIPSGTTQTVENPLAEFGVPAPGSDLKVSNNVNLIKIVGYVALVIIGLIILGAVFKLLTLKR